MPRFEPPALPPPRAWEVARDVDRHAIANGIAATVMACTGPFVVMLGVAAESGIPPEELASWMFGGFSIGGVLSIVFSVLYRMPMGMAWSIPAVILLGGALGHLSFAEALGAFWGAAALITVLGVTGWVGRIAALVPLPVVMAMVAGVFLPFVVKLVAAFPSDWVVATATVATFTAFSGLPILGRRVPPILAALVVGTGVVAGTGGLDLSRTPGLALVRPILFVPELSWQALGELVVPLAITVVGIHNMQGFAVLRANGYAPPVNVLTTACGLGSFAFALVGAVPTCVTGPANAMLNASGARSRRYVGGILFGVLMLAFGLLAPTSAGLALALPTAFIGLLGGLALLPVLGGAFQEAFGGRASAAAVVAFVMSVADIPIASIGAPFWALVVGTAIHYLGAPARRAEDRDE